MANLQLLFSNSFDTFKVFENLTVEIAIQKTPGTPKTTWEILNHLIIWQQHQLLFLKGESSSKHVSEMETWNSDNLLPIQNIVDNAVSTFNNQINEIKTIASTI